MHTRIKPIPDIPTGLREAASVGRLTPFIGAGASRLAGCPDWTTFANLALEFFTKRGVFSYAQLDQMRSLHPRVKLSIAMQLQKKHKLAIDFSNLLHSNSRRDDPKGQRLYAALTSLATIFVTTNYDRWLDTTIQPIAFRESTTEKKDIQLPELKRTSIYKINDLAPHVLNQPNTVVHLHGSIDDPQTMILTTQDYVKHYANDRMANDRMEENRVLTFLDFLFQNKTVLFVGYGLEELEILEYAIGKVRIKTRLESRKVIRHYILQGFYSHQKELCEVLTGYFAECGIELIPFLLDHRNWEQLIEVLEEYARNIPGKAPNELEKLVQMEKLLNG